MVKCLKIDYSVLYNVTKKIHKSTLKNTFLTCTTINISNKNKLRIQDVFQELEDQEKIGKLVFKILQKRARLIDELETSLPGAILDQGAHLQGATAV